MKAKFLIPEIDKTKFAEELSKNMKIFELKLKSLTEVGVEDVSEVSISQYKKGIKFPTINRFLSLCRFFTNSPDVFLSPIPKWIECEIDDISKFSVLGKFNDVYYIAPNYDKKSNCVQEIPNLSEEPKPESFIDFHLYGTNYDDTEKINEGKIVYRFPNVNDIETSKNITNLLSEYKISKDQLQILLGYNQQESIRLRENHTRPWNLENIYKFSWIFNKPIEEILVIDYREETHESLFNPVIFLEHYVSEEEKETFPSLEELFDLMDESTKKSLFEIEEINVPIEED